MTTPPSGRFRPLRELVDFWAKPIRAESLALFRILIGVNLLVCMLATFAPDLNHYTGRDGLIPARTMDDYLKRGRFCLLRGPVSKPYLEDWKAGTPETDP